MSDSDDSDLTMDLEQVGKISLPTLESLKSLPMSAELLRDAARRNFASGSLAIDNYFSSRRELVQAFIDDLISGFSLQSAFDRIQPVTTKLSQVVNEAVHLPIEGEDDEKYHEPGGVRPVVIHEAGPIIESLVIPDEQPLLDRYAKLTLLEPGDFADQKVMRQKIKDILGLAELSGAQKSVLIQKLMTQSYYQKKKLEGQPIEAEIEDVAGDSGDSDTSSLFSSEDEAFNDDHRVRLTMMDKAPTQYADGILGCQHYQRNCKVECPICKRWFTCRFCHDAVVKDHALPRNQIRHVLCMFCSTPQRPAQYCINPDCGKILAEYYCDKCKLFDNDPVKDIYHCDDCGICRLGLGLNQDFFHCRNCDACISIELKEGGHRCIENSTHADCPICEEYMFNSTRTVCVMSCGHAIHQSCYDEYTQHSYKCPICSRTITNMETQFRVMDNEIDEQPLPPPFGNWKCIIKCIDCGGMSICKYHVLGLRCDNCKSYNTMQLKVIKPELGDDEDKVFKATNKGEGLGVIPNTLNTNFGYDQADLLASAVSVGKTDGSVDPEFKNEHDMIEDSYADDFMRIVENLERYSTIGDAFKDWLNTNKEVFSSLSLSNPKKSEKNENEKSNTS
ncbi:unnamed protein product [Kuraishia capsulata CBS 1993]|uniref:RING-type domain-containing protein n=1 Tax=Kuraishia capsulata CBS 1993 TaxID=1382522 RepID=W6MMJ7_9ASCO|nr:uncharacterized protein KUCA_T00003406001 [Kuraishia capsulata CBS 1993]CDK27428.1 unnamed protein product [Kuraishia capsulata CBS 1993]